MLAITFICTGKLKNSYDWLYFNICLIVVVWNQICNTSEVYLYVILGRRFFLLGGRRPFFYFLASTIFFFFKPDFIFYSNHIYFKFIYLFIYGCVGSSFFCARAFSSCGKRGPLFIAMRGPLTIAASLVAEHRLQTRRLSSCGSRA